MKTFYFILRAVRPSTGSKCKRFFIRVGNDLHTSIADAIFELEIDMGPGWRVHGENVSRQHFDMLVAAQSKEDECILRG